MGVIGRLDDQVNELIIKPLGERDGRATSEPQAPSEAGAAATSTKAQENRPQGEDKRSGRSPDLPVWLL